MGANFDDVDLEKYYIYVGYGVILADALVVLYGLREKFRTRMNLLVHLPTFCLGCLLKFSVKSVIHICICAALVASSVGLVERKLATFVFKQYPFSSMLVPL